MGEKFINSALSTQKQRQGFYLVRDMISFMCDLASFSGNSKQSPINRTEAITLRNLVATLLAVCAFSCDAQVTAVYAPVTKPDFQQAAEAFKRAQLLEQMVDVINAPFAYRLAYR